MARDVSTSSEDQFVGAGLRVLAERGAAELTVRRVAEAAGASTMGIYTRFGSRAGMLEAIYRRGFELLRDALVEARDAAPAGVRIVPLAIAYRRVAPGNPPPYPVMFEPPLPRLSPPPAPPPAAPSTPSMRVSSASAVSSARGWPRWISSVRSRPKIRCLNLRIST